MRFATILALIRFAAEKLEWRIRQWLLQHEFSAQDLGKMSRQFYESVPDVGDLTEFDYRNYVLKYVVHTSKKFSSVLDIGCGDGRVVANLHLANKVGVDFSRNLLQAVRRRDPTTQVVAADAEHLPFKRFAFDLVTTFDVLEHVQKPDDVFKEARRVGRFRIVFTTDYEGILNPSPRYQLIDNTPKLKLIRSWNCHLTFFRLGKPTPLWKGLLFGSGVMGTYQYTKLDRKKRNPATT